MSDPEGTFRANGPREHQGPVRGGGTFGRHAKPRPTALSTSSSKPASTTSTSPPVTGRRKTASGRGWPEHPGEFFLATKTGERTADGARKELERSLERMGVDHVDLWQLHNLVDPIEWDDGPQRRGCARGRRSGPRGGTGPFHRRDRPRTTGGGDAPALARAF